MIPASDELKKVYRKLASKYHPDSGGSHKNFININSAYETLKKSSSSSSQVPPQSNQQRQQPSNQQSSNQQSSNQQSTSDDLDKEKFIIKRKKDNKSSLVLSKYINPAGNFENIFSESILELTQLVKESFNKNVERIIIKEIIILKRIEAEKYFE